MSALGQKRTLPSAGAMSALPPKADIAGRQLDVRFVPIADIETLFDHLVSRDKKLRMKLQAERFGCLEVDHELKLDGLNHWEISWLFALKDSPGIEAGLMKGLGDAGAITH
jgi:hypothetical protein